MRGVTFLTILLSAAVFAGCIGDEGDVDLPDDVPAFDVEAYALPRLVQGHDHETDHAEHAGRVGLDVLSVATGPDAAQGAGYGELVVKGDFAYLAISKSAGNVDPAGFGGFFILDVSDPAAPQTLGFWEGQPLGDLEVTDDGAFAFAPTQRNGYPYSYALDVPADGLLPRGAAIVDVSDKANPTTVGYAPLPPNGPHTVNYFQMPDGRELLFAATYDILFTAYPENVGQNTATQKVVIYEFVRTPEPHLVPLSVFQIVKPDEGDDQYLPHDATAHIDPATGRVIMDIAYWDLGLVTVDITDPSDPQELGRFSDVAPSQYVHTHLVRVFPGTIDGRVVGLLEPEIPTGDDSGTFTFVDLTDPAAPKKLGTWMAPGELIVDIPFKFSPHNFDLVCGGDGQVTGRQVDYGAPCADPQVVLSHNHAGLWVLDAADPTQPVARAFYFPEKTEDGPVPSGFGTVFVQGGTIYAPEYRTGLHVMRLADLPSA